MGTVDRPNCCWMQHRREDRCAICGFVATREAAARSPCWSRSCRSSIRLRGDGLAGADAVFAVTASDDAPPQRQPIWSLRSPLPAHDKRARLPSRALTNAASSDVSVPDALRSGESHPEAAVSACVGPKSRLRDARPPWGRLHKGRGQHVRGRRAAGAPPPSLSVGEEGRRHGRRRHGRAFLASTTRLPSQCARASPTPGRELVRHNDRGARTAWRGTSATSPALGSGTPARTPTGRCASTAQGAGAERLQSGRSRRHRPLPDDRPRATHDWLTPLQVLLEPGRLPPGSSFGPMTRAPLQAEDTQTSKRAIKRTKAVVDDETHHGTREWPQKADKPMQHPSASDAAGIGAAWFRRYSERRE